jgi:cadmium resistance protein CadD (predicted permease)
MVHQFAIEGSVKNTPRMLVQTHEKTKMVTEMEKARKLFIEITGYLFLFLFLYTAYSKLAEHEKFAGVLAISPLIGPALSEWVAWGIPVVEIVIGLLLLPCFRTKGLYAAVALMIVFTTYLVYMILKTGLKLPCHCGGVISNLSWQQHIWFNLFFIVAGLLALYFTKHYKRTNDTRSYANGYAV